MLSIDRQAEKIRRRDHLIRQLYMLVICLGLIVIMLAAMIFAMTRTAAARERPEVCLTKSEARKLWPKKHIYWYSSDHCWSNRRGPPRGLKFDPVFSKANAQATEQEKKPRKLAGPAVKIVKAEDYNEIDALADVDVFFDAQPVPFWRFSALYTDQKQAAFLLEYNR